MNDIDNRVRAQREGKSLPNLLRDDEIGCSHSCLCSQAADEIERLRAALSASRRHHYGCEDRWYSCPKHEEGCDNERDGPECNCGADEHNADIDAALAIEQLTTKEG